MGRGQDEHDFYDSLARSHAAANLPIWKELYEKAFGGFVCMGSTRGHGQHQREGIDRGVMLANGKHVWIDEKVRGRNAKTGRVYEDILLEYWSDYARRVRGWVCKPLLCDYIAYAIAPIGKGYLLPVIQLQAAWRARGDEWIARAEAGQPGYRICKAKNRNKERTWETVALAIPPRDLYPAIGKCLRVSFQPCEFSE